MSDLIFPATPGEIRVRRTLLTKTAASEADDGREFRVGKYPLSRYRYEVRWGFLRQAAAYQEAQRIWRHFVMHGGRRESFRFQDPDDYTVTDHGFGVGDATKTKFPLQRTPGGQWQDALGTWSTYDKPRKNLFLWSQQITSGWTKNVGSETFAADIGVAPDGTVTACSIKSGAAVPGGMFQSLAFVPGAAVISVWLRVPSGTKSAVLAFSGIASQIVTVSTAWQRFSFSAAVGSAAVPCVVYWEAAAAGEVLYVWGAQAEQGSTATRYIPTTSAAVRADPSYWTADQTTGALVAPGAPDGFEPVTEPDWATVSIFADADGLGRRTLVPWQRTNIALQSQTLDNATWTKTNVTVTADATAAPDGTATADKVAETAVTGAHNATQSIALGVGVHTFSVYAKAAERTRVALQIFSAADNSIAQFDLATGTMLGAAGGGTATGISATCVPAGNGWFRLTLTHTIGTAGTFTLYVELRDANGAATYLGIAGSGLYAWGAQLEPGMASVGDYISTTTAAVARTDFTMGAQGLVTFAVAPRSGCALSWTGNFWRRVRFDDDEADFERIVNDVKSGAIELVSVV